MDHSADSAFNVLWLQSGGCGGCTLSLLCAESPDLFSALEGAGIQFLWHPSFSEATGEEAVALLEAVASGERRLDALCVEGSLLRGPNGTGGFHVLAGTGVPMIHWVQRLAAVARYTVAVGTCAAFGGITSGGPNPTDACGLQYEGEQSGGLLGPDYRAAGGLPVVNVAGCPTHPDWVLETLLGLAWDGAVPGGLDEYARPRFYTDHLVHHGCARNEYYEYKASAEHPSQQGCLMEHMGCLGTQARADCNLRPWNGAGSCTDGGYPCVRCTSPEFEEPGHPFLETPKVAGIPVGLPTDMPKAWFVALASLAKSATPQRVRDNASADHVAHPPAGRSRHGRGEGP
jgi:NiFe hydrogenase small subunit HydA